MNLNVTTLYVRLQRWLYAVELGVQRYSHYLTLPVSAFVLLSLVNGTLLPRTEPLPTTAYAIQSYQTQVCFLQSGKHSTNQNLVNGEFLIEGPVKLYCQVEEKEVSIGELILARRLFSDLDNSVTSPK
jgi:hypothetical protein